MNTDLHGPTRTYTDLREYPYVWYWRKYLPERKGQRCRVLKRAPNTNSVLVEFMDGEKAISSRWAVRLAKG